MIDLEENKRNLDDIKKRIDSIGDYLWLAKNGRKTQ